MEKWKNNKFIENLKIKQYPAYQAEFIVFLCVTLFRQKMAEKRYTICILLSVGLSFAKHRYLKLEVLFVWTLWLII